MAENAPSIEDRISAAMAPEIEAHAAPIPQPEEVEVEQIDAAPAPEVAQEAPQAPQEEEVEIESLDALAEHLGVEVADLYNVKFGATDGDGNRVDLSIGELKDIYQNREKVSKAEKELQAKQAEWKAREDANREAFVKAENERATMFAAIEQDYLADYAQVNWAELEAHDPGRAALARQHFEMRRQKLLQMRNQAASEYEAKQREHFASLVQQEQERVRVEDAILTEKWPEWRDPNKRAELGNKLSAFLTNAGYSEDQIFGRRLPDGNHVGGLSAKDILLARDAMAWRDLQTKGDVAKKKVVKLGKRILTGGPRQPNDQAQRNESTLKTTLRKSGKVEDAAALIQSRLGR